MRCFFAAFFSVQYPEIIFLLRYSTSGLLRFQYLKFQRLMLDELETALSVISVSYERTENILQSVEENIDSIQPPIRQAFKEFLLRVKLVDPDIEAAIDEMKTKINHSVFYEWCDALKRCNEDRSLKHTLAQS